MVKYFLGVVLMVCEGVYHAREQRANIEGCWILILRSFEAHDKYPTRTKKLFCIKASVL